MALLICLITRNAMLYLHTVHTTYARGTASCGIAARSAPSPPRIDAPLRGRCALRRRELLLLLLHERHMFGGASQIVSRMHGMQR